MRRTTAVIGAACAALLFFSGWQLVGIGLSYRKGTETYEALRESYTAPAPPEAPEEGAGEEGGKTVDFDRLRLANADIAGWLYSPGTAIDYPVVQGADNDFYLRHTYNGEYNQAGTLFLDCRSSPGFADATNFIYGHNMKNGSMFHSLLEYRSQEYYETHPEMYLYTPQGDYRLVLFSARTVREDDEVYTICPAGGELPEAQLTDWAAASDFLAHADLPQAGPVVTLSTCTNQDDLERYVVQGILLPLEG